MKLSPSRRTVIVIWFVWALIMIGYQAYVRARFQPERPDYAVSFWTPNETESFSQDERPYLLESFLNDHVSWDSEYYLSIALGGYDDPQMRSIPPDFNWRNWQMALKGDAPGEWVSMNHAFLPFYPFAMRVLYYPLQVFGLNPIATATLAGMIVSLLGTLLAMLALHDLAHDDARAGAGDSGGVRAAFYLIIFPAGMFLAQVYTEGLFLGLSFAALALARRQRWIWAALLAMGAVWTRAAGGLLLIPLLWYWWQSGGLRRLRTNFSWCEVGTLLILFSPVLAYAIWSALLGQQFHLIESNFFSRGLLLINQSYEAWRTAWEGMIDGRYSAERAYYLIEFAAIVFGVITCLWMWKRDKALMLYGLATIAFALTSGGAQGMHRYVMAAPAVFLVPAMWGRREAFDRSWTLGNVLLMGIYAAMFSFDFWAG
jgi:hypothetical protein